MEEGRNDVIGPKPGKTLYIKCLQDIVFYFKFAVFKIDVENASKVFIDAFTLSVPVEVRTVF